MKMFSRVLAAILLGAISSQAQQYNGHGYGYVGIDQPNGGTFAELLSVGAGGEGFVWKNLAAGVEVGYLFPRDYAGEGIGLFSPDVSWHFVNRRNPAKVVPFVTGGYSLAFRSGIANLVNYGGGVTWWLVRRAGLRTEVRGYHYVGSGSAAYLTTELRFGVAFR